MDPQKKPKVIISVTNDLATDNRVKKICALLIDMGAEVTFVGRLQRDSQPIDLGFPTHRFAMWFSAGGLFYAEYSLRLFFYLLWNKADLLVSNDLDTLLPNYLISVLKNIDLVYDTHEYFLGVPEIQGRWVKKIWALIERWIFPRLKTVFTVNQSIANLYHKEYAIRPMVFRNIGAIPKGIETASRSKIGIPEDAFVFINQGSGINVDRGMEEALEALAEIGDAHLLLVGKGDIISKLKEDVQSLGLTKRVHFVDRVPYSVLLGYTKMANAGLSLDKPTNINYQFSLPNKLFDYLHCGIPVLCSEVVEVKSIVEEYSVGIVVDSREVSSVAAGMRNMMSSGKDEFDSGLLRAQAELTWEKESESVRNVYSILLFP